MALKAFADLSDAELADLAQRPDAPVAIGPAYLASVIENLKVLREHAARVAAAAPDGPASPEAFEP